jgi:tetratricopeptide (TPR) repeat protein
LDLNEMLFAWGKVAEAEPYYQRAVLLSPSFREDRPFAAVRLEFEPVLALLNRGEPRLALQLADSLAKDYAQRSPQRQNALAYEEASIHLAVGQIAKAAQWAEKMNGDSEYAMRFRVAAARGDAAEERRCLKLSVEQVTKAGHTPSTFLTGWLASAGVLDEATKWLGRLEKDMRDRASTRSPASLEWARGEVALASHRPAEAVPHLQYVFSFRPQDTTDRPYTGLSLAKAYVSLGHPEKAIELLEAVESAPVFNERPVFLNLDTYEPRLYLAALYRKAGRSAAAERIEEQIRKYLAIADPDYPLAMKLKAQPSLRTGKATPRIPS